MIETNCIVTFTALFDVFAVFIFKVLLLYFRE